VEAPTKDQRFNYAGIEGAVAGVVGLLGIYAGWWETDAKSYYATADISGQLALAMSIGLFAFGVAYVVFSDQRIRREMGALMTLCGGRAHALVPLGLAAGRQRCPRCIHRGRAPGVAARRRHGGTASMLAVKYAADEDASTAPTGDGHRSDAVSQEAPSTG
jgi:hypothetical protein